MRKHNLPVLLGAGLGFVVFLAVALLPTLVYGGYAGLLLAGGIFGTPVEQTILSRGLIVFGMSLGVTAVAFLFTIAGAASGALVGTIVKQLAPKTEVSKAESLVK
ncbi:MAG: hypothetical protein AABZ06_10490 [Bdellovibrionota bacterium]